MPPEIPCPNCGSRKWLSANQKYGSMYGITKMTRENPPRELIDAKKNDKDDQFIVLVDGQKAEFNEVAANQTERTLRIDVLAQTKKVEIIGTHVIPEFPVNVMMI